MTVHVMRDVYGEQMCQVMEDDTWIHDVTAQGWTIFSKDYAMRTDHLGAINTCGAKVFLIPDARMKAADQAQRYVDNRYRIAIKSSGNGPMLYRVDPKGLTMLPLKL